MTPRGVGLECLQSPKVVCVAHMALAREHNTMDSETPLLQLLVKPNSEAKE